MICNHQIVSFELRLFACCPGALCTTYQDEIAKSRGYLPTAPVCLDNSPRNSLGGAYSDNAADAKPPQNPCTRHRFHPPI